MKQELSVVGIDIAKRVFHLAGFEHSPLGQDPRLEESP